MKNNSDTLTRLVARKTLPLDLGGYADEWAGETLQVNVNAPGIIEATTRVEKNDYDGYRTVVAALFDLPAEVVATFDDNFLVWLFVEGTRVYVDYHASLKKKSSDN